MNTSLPMGLDEAWNALHLVLAWLSQHEALLIFLSILVEESGVPMPIPADVAMALMGTRVAQGQMSLPMAFLIGQSATLIGSSILYWAGRRGGRPLLFRFGKLLHLNAHRIAQAERLVTRLGPLSVIIGRQIPGLRLAAPLACGVFRIPFRLFIPAMFVGSSLYIGIFIALGMWGGPAVLRILRSGGLSLRFLFLTVVLAASAFVLRYLSRRVRDIIPPVYRTAASRWRSMEAALLAGLASSILTGLVVAWMLSLVALISQTPPERALLHWLESATAGSLLPDVGPSPQRLAFVGLLATVPFEVASHIFWAVVYAFVFESRLRGGAALRGLQFAVVPWLVSGLLIFPLLDGGLFGVDFGAGLLPLAGETLRLAIFGLTLGSIYRLIRLARQPRPHSGHRHGHRHRPGLPVSAADGPSAPRPQAASSPPGRDQPATTISS